MTNHSSIGYLPSIIGYSRLCAASWCNSSIPDFDPDGPGAIADRDSEGNGKIRLHHMVEKSREFRDEFRTATEQSLPKPAYGTLVFINNCPYPVTLRVNGTAYYTIYAFSSMEIRVPRGTATTELVGYEAPKNWFVGAPDFMQRIVINSNAYGVSPLFGYAPF